ncbi:MAG TPA: hypothetical protein VHB02_05295 [Acidimicrobiales bacterium]|nr:hypothetical protein [Acidimicrobiales bacterium]
MAAEVGTTTRMGGASPDDVGLGLEAWSGWLIFAGLVLLVAGTMRIFDSVWAFTYNGTLPENLDHALFGRSLSTYGWLWLVVGIVLFVSGCAVMVRSPVARWIGVFAGALGAVSAIWWMPYYPVWSLVYIGLGILVIYALVAHWQPGAPGGR